MPAKVSVPAFLFSVKAISKYANMVKASILISRNHRKQTYLPPLQAVNPLRCPCPAAGLSKPGRDFMPDAVHRHSGGGMLPHCPAHLAFTLL
jgi:hypothetical protein